jgi:hypothetical protein
MRGRAMNSTAHSFANHFLQAALQAHMDRYLGGDTTEDSIGWKRPDGTEVLRVGNRLLVAESDGRVIVRDKNHDDVPTRDIVADMRARGE